MSACANRKGWTRSRVFRRTGNRIVFTSDAGGSPQIYEQNMETGDVRRLSFGSRYNTEPSYSSNGRQVVFLRKDDNGYNISLMDVDSGKIDVLTAIGLADSPAYRRMTPWRYLRTKNAPITCLPFRLMVKLCYHWIFGRRGL